jgi:hypothetical protein
VIAGAPAIFVPETFEFFDVRSQVLLRAVAFRADQTADASGPVWRCRKQKQIARFWEEASLVLVP